MWAATIVLVATVVVGGARADGYSHVAHFISELGARGASDGAAVSAAFGAVGVLVALAGVAVVRTDRSRGAVALAAAALAIAIGYGTAGVARCEPGCPESGGDVAQLVHNTAGGIEYVGAAAAILVACGAARRESAPRFAARSAGAVAVVAAAVVLGAAIPDQRGLWQRVAEVALFAWLLVAIRRRAASATR